MALLPGKRLWLFCDRANRFPRLFASLLARTRKPSEKFESDHYDPTNPRCGPELEYGRSAVEQVLADDPLWRDDRRQTGCTTPTTTPRAEPQDGRNHTLLQDGTRVLKTLALMHHRRDRSAGMVLRAAWNSTRISRKCWRLRDLEEGAIPDPKHYVVEKRLLSADPNCSGAPPWLSIRNEKAAPTCQGRRLFLAVVQALVAACAYSASPPRGFAADQHAMCPGFSAAVANRFFKQRFLRWPAGQTYRSGLSPSFRSNPVQRWVSAALACRRRRRR